MQYLLIAGSLVYGSLTYNGFGLGEVAEPEAQ